MNVADYASILAAGASVLSLIGLGVVWWQVKVNHDRARREKAIELMQFFIMGKGEKSGLLLQTFADRLSKSECEFILNGTEVAVDDSLKDLLLNLLDKDIEDPKLEESNGKIRLTLKEIIVIRKHIGRYLNVLETVAAAWYYHVADREIIENEFKTIISKRTGEFIYENYRKASGYYPSLRKLIDRLDIQQNAVNERTPPA